MTVATLAMNRVTGEQVSPAPLESPTPRISLPTPSPRWLGVLLHRNQTCTVIHFTYMVHCEV